MERFAFDNRKERGYANAGRESGSTIHGFIDIYPNFVSDKLLSLDIRGPGNAERGSAHIDKATAGKLGAALLKWAGTKEQGICPVCLEKIVFNALPRLGGPVMFSCGCTP